MHHLQSLKAFIVNHPPLVVFTACIFLFGVTTFVLAFVVGKYDLPNPDITMDWNVFLTHLTQRNLCVHSRNVTENQQATRNTKNLNSGVIPGANATANTTVLVSPEPLIGVEELSLSELLPDISSLKSGKAEAGPSKNVTKSMIVPLTFDVGLLQLPPTVTWLKGHVTGRHVGYAGSLSKETIHVNMFLPNNLKKKTSHCKGDADCKILLDVCIVFFGPATVIPTSRQTSGCRRWTNDVKHAANTTWYLPDYVPNQCKGKTQLTMTYKKNPKFTAMLSDFDKSIATLHLMHTSYFIFIIVITMLCYVLVRSHFRNTKVLTSEKINL